MFFPKKASALIPVKLNYLSEKQAFSKEEVTDRRGHKGSKSSNSGLPQSGLSAAL